MKHPARLLFLGFLLFIIAISLLLSSGHVSASTSVANSPRSGLLAIAVSTHGNVDFAGRAEESFQYVCNACHDPHGGTGNLGGVAKYLTVNMSPFTISGPVLFTSLAGTNSFDDGISDATSRICVACHINANRPGSATAMSHTGGFGHLSGDDYSGQDCTTCHLHDPDGNPATVDGFMPVGGVCNSCHGAPPATGSHVTHSNPAMVPTVYGETGVHSTPTAYDFSCGECHPTDVSQHMNGTVDVVLTSTNAPAGSLKARDDVNASYDAASKTCSGSYCHSGERVAPTGPVDWPLLDGLGNPILDSHNNPTYTPYTSTVFRAYVSPVWGGTLPDNGGPEGTCDACHQFPLTTSFREGVMGGAVDSHQWISPDPFFGGTYGTLHGDSYMADPFPCRTCHYQTVTTLDALTPAQRIIFNSFGDQIAVFGALPIADRTFHVNGNQDVAFDTSDTVRFYSTSGAIQMPVRGTYFPAQKSCGNVSCHGYDLPTLINKDIGGQNYVVWGAPYHVYESSSWEGCEFCHRPSPYGGHVYPVLAACNTCHLGMVATPSDSLFSASLFKNASYRLFNASFVLRKNVASLPAQHPTKNCLDCHTPHMKDPAASLQTWTMDKIAPETEILNTPENPSFESEATFTFSSPDLTATFECSLNDSVFAVCTSPKTYTELNQGSYTFQVRAKDKAGNLDATPASYTWNLYTLRTTTYTSAAANDGWIMESRKASNTGGAMSSSSFLRIGNGGAGKQYRSILDFNTASLPDNAIITAVTIKVRTVENGSSFGADEYLLSDMKPGAFGASTTLQLEDFNAPGYYAGKLIALGNNWYELVLSEQYRQYVNLTGVTQFRLRLMLNNAKEAADFIKLYSGDSPTDPPFLIVEYYLP